MALRAVVANLGCASPGRGQGGRIAAAIGHAERLQAAGLDLVFAQEVPNYEWGELWADYEASTPAAPVYKAKSVLLWRRETVEKVGELILPTATYHGSYVAGALLDLGPGLGPVAVLSFHASPTPLVDRDLRQWDACGRPRPPRRRGGGRDTDKWFDADLVLETIDLAQHEYGLVIAAGDANECLAWDRDHEGEDWGAKYFARVRAKQLVPALHACWPATPSEGTDGSIPPEPWDVERPTFFGIGRTPYQLDHVLVSRGFAISADPPTRPDRAGVLTGESSDHAEVGFTVSHPALRTSIGS